MQREKIVELTTLIGGILIFLGFTFIPRVEAVIRDFAILIIPLAILLLFQGEWLLEKLNIIGVLKKFPATFSGILLFKGIFFLSGLRAIMERHPFITLGIGVLIII